MGTQRPGPFFENLIRRLPEVMAALDEQTSPCGFPVYSSLDIRDAGWKVAAVDVNLFPAGFNNLAPDDTRRAAAQMREFLTAKLGPAPSQSPWRLTVVPEAHTNNAGYLDNLAGILRILQDAGCETKLLWPGDPIPKAWKIKTASGYELEYLPAAEALQGAQALLLNHDLSGGVPKAIAGVTLPTFPSPKLGWYRRRKSKHQEIVEGLLARIAHRLDFFDPWYFSVRTHMIPAVDFNSDASLEQVAQEAFAIMEQLRGDYEARGIEDKPRIFIKNDAGTYGIGVVSVANPDDIRQGGRWLKNKMRKGKDAVPISQVIIQEAIPTAFVYTADPTKPESAVAGEPVLYLVNGSPVGGFCRVHEGLGADARWENMNQPGGKLEPLDCPRPFPRTRHATAREQVSANHVYAFIARLHSVAASLEECPGAAQR